MTLKQAIMMKDGCSDKEAQDQMDEASDQLMEYLADGDIMSADDICMEFFGLEADYIMELI